MKKSNKQIEGRGIVRTMPLTDGDEVIVSMSVRDELTGKNAAIFDANMGDGLSPIYKAKVKKVRRGIFQLIIGRVTLTIAK